MNSIDFGRAFKAPFEDPDWFKKTLFGLLWGVLVVTSFALMGAMLDYIKSVANGNERLPEWDDFGGKWVRGFMVFLAGLIFFLPVWVLGLIFLVPTLLVARTNSDILGAVAGGGMCIFWLMAIVYSIAVAIYFYSAMVNYAMTGEFGAFFKFGENFERVRTRPGYWTAFLIAIVASFAAGMIGSLLGAIPVVGWLLSFGLTYLAYMVGAHGFGQWTAIAYGLPGPGGVTGYPPLQPGYAPPPPPAYTPPAPPAAPTYAPPATPAEPQAASPSEDTPAAAAAVSAAPVEPPAPAQPQYAQAATPPPVPEPEPAPEPEAQTPPESPAD